MNVAQKLWRRGRDLFPVAGFHFDHPIVLFQSDDWGRVGLREQEGLEELRAGGLALGERPYDFYTLENSDDLSELSALLKRHCDSNGCHPSIQMNFILANLDFARMSADAYQKIHMLPLAEGLPQGWHRAGLMDAYREGMEGGFFCPGLHGTTHFCRSAVERSLAEDGERADLLRTLWRAGIPYIHWRMPWIGYEYWDPEKTEDERFLVAEAQRELIGQTVGAFAKLFSKLPRSACAPGYRANSDTHQAWAQHGIRVAQNGPGALMPPHFDRYEILHLCRTVEFEPAVDSAFSVGKCLLQADACFELGIPVVVSVHTINFHSAVRDFRSDTLRMLDQFLTAIESKYPDLLYLHDENVYELVMEGAFRTKRGTTRLNVTKKNFSRAEVLRLENI